MIRAFGIALLLFGLPGIWLWGYSGQNPAEADSSKTKRFTLDTVRIIAERTGATIGHASYEAIQRGEQASPLTIKDALGNLPGIAVSVGTKDESNLRIRGFRKNEVKVMIDGRPLNPGYFGNADLNSIALSGIKEIVYIKGPASALYGANTMGGVVNLITERPSSQKWARIGLSAKRNNTNLIELSSAHSFETWDYWLYTSRTHSDGIVLSEAFSPTALENGGVRNNSQSTQYSIQSKLNLELGDFHSVGIGFGVNSTPKKLIASSVYEAKYRMFRDWLRTQASVISSSRLEDNLGLTAMLYYDSAMDTYQEFNDPLYQYLGVDSTLKNYTLGFAPRLEADLGAWGITNLGLRAERITNSRKDNGSYPDWTDNFMNLYNAFLQHEFWLLPNTTLHTGIGFSAFDLDIRKEISAFWEPSVSLSIKDDQGRSISLALGINTAYPTMRQLFSADRGNPDLEAQKATKYELSGQLPLQLGNTLLMLSGSLYYNDISGLIDIKDGKYQNLNQVRTYGAETGISIHPISAWEIEASYAYLDNLSADQYTLLESPRNSMEIMNLIWLPFKIRAGIGSSYKDIRFSQDAVFSYKTLDSYWQHNIQFSRQWQDMKLFMGVENILDTDYEMEYGYPAAGRNFNLGIEYQI